MKSSGMRRTIVLLAVLVMVPGSLWAFGGPQRDGRRGPPPEAIEACKGKQVGDTVEFTSRRGEKLEATCKEMDGQLAAVPKNPPKGGERQ